MSPENTKTLLEKYPKLFKPNPDPNGPLSLFGFEHDDGWFPIIKALCGNIQSYLDHVTNMQNLIIQRNRMIESCKNGDWTEFDLKYSTYNPSYVEREREEILKQEVRPVPSPVEQVVLQQVKEKFGTLRFYYTGGDSYIQGLVSMAESMSGVMCEECGSPGKTEGPGWIRTLCETHRKKHRQ
jgi:hypothetical protein